MGQGWAASSHTIPDGDGGAIATLALMRELTLAAAVAPSVRALAAELCRRAWDPVVIAGRIRAFLGRHTQFVSDPLGEELLTSPAVAIDAIHESGEFAGDCDDIAMLGAALARALGLRVRFVTVAFHTPSEPLSHVWTEIWTPAGWMELDTTREMQGPGADVTADPSRMLLVDLETGATAWAA